MTEEIERLHASGRRITLAGMAVLALLMAGGAVWGLGARIEGAVVADGTLVVDGNVKAVQHPSGGRVTAVHTADGARVAAGEALVTLDDTALRAELGVLGLRLATAELRLERLRAEIAGAAWTPAEMSPEALSELRLHEARRADRDGRRQQVAEQIAGLRRGLGGLGPQRMAREEELALVREELATVETLYEKGLVTRPRLTALKRSEAGIEGALAQMDAQAETMAAAIAEAEARLGQIDRDAAAQAAREIREAESAAAELTERRRAVMAELEAAVVRAPVAGQVHAMAIHGRGAVVAPGQVMLSVVPDAARLVAEVMVAPAEIDRVGMGAPVHLRLLAGPQRVAPVLEAQVSRLDPDAVSDAQSGASGYRVRASLPAEMATATGVALRPGMPVQAVVVAEAQAPLVWLLAPLADQMARAWRER